ncbi:DUF167 domain-containing protein [Granulicella mallensis]|uniref:UPF0235 protein AciX8_4149 n=1 Tax=Granulicella mallensis (strain ATCC BAA-1857 / DSM 23137 / MP5ACTX8) TaxID=682795 RepID=G8NQW7_GRAMM|nr:DUF167 domain-containing protein [Granulicella mallensis]AEU38430.1 UPF0235 protein yggU [Granulicella mallensis MP5ACTX8]
MILALRDTPGGCSLPVRVHPGAKQNAVTGTHDGSLKISLTTPPTDGRANTALIAFLSDRLNIPRAHIELLTGATSRSKTLRIAGLTSAEVEARLLTDLA